MNEESIRTWIKARACSCDQSGLEQFRIWVDDGGFYACGLIEGKHQARYAPTIDEAVAKLRELIPPPAERAKQLREEARRLLRQAVDLEVSAGGVQ